jgi:hypothetical protein
MIVQMGVGHDFNKVFIIWASLIELQKYLLATKHESQLLLNSTIQNKQRNLDVNIIYTNQ